MRCILKSGVFVNCINQITLNENAFFLIKQCRCGSHALSVASYLGLHCLICSIYVSMVHVQSYYISPSRPRFVKHAYGIFHDNIEDAYVTLCKSIIIYLESKCKNVVQTMRHRTCIGVK